ncbi:MAG: CHAT domain-containing protein [Saprospiraceae bacterium]|nr:CHAT domain-containing protein [Saprospiraceae bacterium]
MSTYFRLHILKTNYRTKGFCGGQCIVCRYCLNRNDFQKAICRYTEGKQNLLVQNNEFSGINLNFLLRKDGGRLGDLYEIISISSARHIAEQGGIKDHLGSTETAALFGNINYNTTPQDKLYVSSDTNVLRGFNNFEFKRQTLYSEGFKWPQLQNSSKEISAIKTNLEDSGVTVFFYEDSIANEYKFKEMYSGQMQSSSPGILHFSTHSFYSENDLSIYGGLFDNYKQLRRAGDLSSVHTGLVMAGANRNWTDSIVSGSDDGILTAFELSQLNLSNTELVVLSACMTGHGQVSASEGVIGLRRAFKIAGVNKMILSLWNVADYQTMELMTLFYKNLCELKMYPRKALKAAQDAMRAKKYEPYYWAGFMLVE